MLAGIHSASYPTSPHPNVASAATRSFEHLGRHLASPLHPPSTLAFAAALQWLEGVDSAGQFPIILDSGCGTGRSTRLLAHQYPEAVVLGVDRSQTRLSKENAAMPLPPNALLIRAELATFWRLLIAGDAKDDLLAASRVKRHLLLYPNPYPKPKRLNRRWQGQATLPCLLAVGDRLELRSNWKIYLEEFELAASTVASAAVDAINSSPPHPATEELPTDAGAAWTYISRRVSQRGTSCYGGSTSVSELHVDNLDKALTIFEQRFVESEEPVYQLVLPSAPSAPSESGTPLQDAAESIGPRGPRRFFGNLLHINKRVGRVAKHPSMKATVSGDSDEDRTVRNLENSLRAAKSLAAEAQNAEARLRNMVASAEKAAEGARAQQVDAEEVLEDVQAELAALQALYSSDVGGLEGEAEELRSEIERLRVISDGEEQGSVSSGSAEAAAAVELAELKEALANASDRALRAEADASDLRDELSAVLQLNKLEAAAREDEFNTLSERLLAAEKKAAEDVNGLGSSARDATIITELRGQVADLLMAYQGQEAAAAELMVLRPKLAKVEAELEDLKLKSKRRPGEEQ